MAYYTDIVTLKNYLPAQTLQQITDDNLTDKIDVEKLNYAILEASNLIDGYLLGRYKLPLTTVPDLIKDIATKLSGYYLFKRSLPQTLPESIKDDYKYVMAILHDVQVGRINPFPVEQNPAWVVSNKNNPSAPHIPDRASTAMATATNNWNSYLV